MATGAVITTEGGDLLLSRTYLSTKTAVSKLRVGVSTATPVVGDTGVNYFVPVTSQLINKCDTPGDFTKSTDAITPTANTTSYKEGYGTIDLTSLNLGKSGTTEALVWYKRAISINMSGTKPYIFMWLYVINAAALAKISNVQIYIRESANYRYWEISGVNLATGWNLLLTGPIDAYTGQSGSAPNLAAIDNVELRVNVPTTATVFSLGDLRMDFWHWELFANGGVDVFTGYPTISSNQLVSRYYISSVQGLGYALSECAEYNTDSTPVSFSHDGFVVTTKSSDIELHFILTHNYLVA